ncbi:MAG: tail fiber domain-containing protein [Clostridiales bacterium]|nr:tail fiber domain-containing protein [Clostridiales bacterium]
MIGYPLDSHVEYDPDGTPIYDRAISSAPMRKLFKELFSDGVLPNPSTNMQVSAGAGMNIIISPGFAMCNGCMKLEEAQRTLAVQASSAAYDRIDTVVLRLNDNDSERICDFYIVQGTPAVSPVRPKLTRTESIWELGLADLFITKNSTAVSNQRITDTRYDSTRCGVMSSISQFDTTTIYRQIQADLGAFRAGEQAAFMAWFDEMKNQLSEDAAGNLQNEIDSTNGRIGNLSDLTSDVKTDLVAALNWVAKSLSAFRDIFNVHSHAWGAITNKPPTYPPSAHNHDERYYTEEEIQQIIRAYLPLNGGSLHGAINFANGVWNQVGDDAYFGDSNAAGCFSVKGISGITGIAIHGRNTGFCRILTDDIAGNLFLATNGALYVSDGNNDARAPIYASAFNQSSSRRVKDHISDVTEEDALKILQLIPVNYDYIGENTPKNCTGLIAEDVAKIFPNCVNGDVNCKDDDIEEINRIGIDYSKFVPYIIKLVQVQERRISELEKILKGAGKVE